MLTIYRSALAAVLVAGFLYLVWRLRHVLLLIYISILFAVIFMPVVRKIQQVRVYKWHPGRGAAVILILISALMIVAAVAIFMMPPIVEDFRNMAEDLPRQVQHFAERVQMFPFGKAIERSVSSIHISTYMREFAGKAIAAAQGVFSGLLNVFLVILLAAYFITNGPEVCQWAISFVPQGQQQRLRSTLTRAAERAQQWLTGQILLMLFLGSASTVVFGLLHIRYFYALGLFAGLANFVPVIGPTATVLVASAVAMLDSWTKVLGVIIFYVVYQQVENAFLSPRIMKAKVGLPGVAVIVALAMGGALAAVPGALVAVPTAAIVATVLNEYRSDVNHTGA